MTQTLQAPDLRTGFPRSPNALLGDYVLLPRIIDKCRATLAGTNGEYNFNCPLDRRFFDFTGIDAEAFRQEVASGKSDQDLLAWVESHSQVKDTNAILVWSYDNRRSVPETPEMKAYFEAMRRQVCPNHTHVLTWFQVLDAEEGRL